MASIISELYDYVFLVVSILLVSFESAATAFTLLLPRRLIGAISAALRAVLPRNPERTMVEEDPQLAAHIKSISEAVSVVELCDLFGYAASEHVVNTPDGYVLGVHRIQPKNGTSPKGVVYLHHGLLMNSEIWVANYRSSDSIAFRLVDAGYEVWMGNNRGNKYSKKHVSRNPSSKEFWNFCIDEFAMYDIPSTVDHILRVSGKESLTYIGFSQGCAQAFASLSIHPELNSKINLFIALGPALAPPRVGPPLLHSLITASPSLLYLLFGRRIILRSTIFWQSIMLPEIYIYMIDLANKLLFQWRSSNMSWIQKRVAYTHLYSFTSVKCVVHWFQIIARNNGIYMFDDDTLSFLGSSFGVPVSRFSQTPPYPTKNITTPIEVIYGTADTLLDIDAFLEKIPTPAAIHPIDDYEHLEMIWGKKVSQKIIPLILEILTRHTQKGARNGHADSEPEGVSDNRSVRNYAPSVTESPDGKLLAISPPRIAVPHVQITEQTVFQEEF